MLSTYTARRIVIAIEAGSSPLLANVEDASVGLAAKLLNVTPTDLKARYFKEGRRVGYDRGFDEDCCDAGTVCLMPSSKPHAHAHVSRSP